MCTNNKVCVTTTTIIIVILCLVKLSAQAILNRCDNTKCSKTMSLTIPDTPKFNIKRSKNKFRVTEGPSKVNVIYSKRRKLSIFCYDGGSLDSNTGCYEKIEDLAPSCSESREWINKKTCPTGLNCPPDGNCIGSDAWKYCVDPPSYSVSIGPKELKWEGSRYFLFSKHTCVSSWECLNFLADVDLFVEKVNNKLRWFYVDKDHNKVLYRPETFESGFVKNGNKQCLREPVSPPNVYDIEGICFSESQENVKCILEGEGDLDGKVIDLVEGKHATLRNYYFKALTPIVFPKEGRLTYEIDNDANKWSQWDDSVSLSRSVNLESVAEVTYSLAATQMQAMYNLISLSQNIEEIQKVILIIVESLGKLDPYLVSRMIYPKEQFMVKWLNDNTFEVCPCLSPPKFQGSNCNGEFKYLGGVYTHQDDDVDCFSYDGDHIENVTLFSKTSIDSNIITNLPLQEASSDSSIWDALNEYRINKIEGDKASHSYSNLQDRLQELESKLGIGVFTRYFWVATSIAAWLSFSLLLCRLGRG